MGYKHPLPFPFYISIIPPALFPSAPILLPQGFNFCIIQHLLTVKKFTTLIDFDQIKYIQLNLMSS